MPKYEEKESWIGMSERQLASVGKVLGGSFLSWLCELSQPPIPAAWLFLSVQVADPWHGYRGNEPSKHIC